MDQIILTALIDEQNCIGCGKCIRVCPTDAIVGAKHMLHTVIPNLCTSCAACINACPTDCISLKTPCPPMIPAREEQLTLKKQLRLATAKSVKSNQYNQVITSNEQASVLNQRKQQIADAIARVKARKHQK